MKSSFALWVSIVSSAVFFAAAPAAAQDGCFAKGDMMLDMGFGVPPFVPGAHFDIAVHDMVSVGGCTGIAIPWVDIPFLARGAFHPFNLPPLQDKIAIRDKLDPYAGLVAGLSISPGESHPVWPTFGEIIGCRFFLSDMFGFYAEECGAGPGDDLGIISGGVVLKF